MERKRPAKLFHKKSRTGCQRCRTRRVKCDEEKPRCRNCTRLELTCEYDRAKNHQPQRGESSASPANEASQEPRAIFDPPESESRRKTELQLFYQYITETGPSIAFDSISHSLWVIILCRTSFQSDAVLYSIYLTAALHMAKKAEYADQHAEDTCRTYLNMALCEHHKDIANLNVDNVDFVCLASTLLRVYGLVKLQDRPLQPYMPPIEWLRMTGTSVAVFRKANRLVQNRPESVAMKIMASVSHFLDDERKDSYGEAFVHLMQRRDPHELVEEWDTETQTAYRFTLNSLGSIWKSVGSGGPPAGVSRRLIAFPLLLTRRFVDMVEEQRPRALVILAHYFAMLAMLRGFWWIGDTGPREVHAIADVVPAEWRSHLSWPMQIMEEQPALPRG